MQLRKVIILAWQVSRNIVYECIRFLVAFVKLRKVTLSFIISPLDGFSRNLICKYFLKFCQEDSSIINPYHANVKNRVSF
jgi:hypothetical protein